MVNIFGHQQDRPHTRRSRLHLFLRRELLAEECISALGDNGFKYLVDVDVSFGKRSAAATNARNCSASTTKPDSTTTPGATVAPSQEATGKPVPAGTQNGAAQSEEAAASSDLSWALWLLGGVVVAGYLAYLFRKRFRRSGEAHALPPPFFYQRITEVQEQDR